MYFPNYGDYTPQSGSLGTIQEEGAATTAEEITAFVDQDAGWTTKIGAGYDATMDLSSNNDSELGSFLSRPTRIAEFQWGVALPLFEQFDPWSLFLNDPRVAEKIANFELYRSQLHVKIVISGTGFHYGRALVSYNPYVGYDEVTVQRAFLQADLVAASQKPHFFLNPTNNTGGQLDLPFFWQDNYLSLSTPADRAKLGQISLKSFTNLQHANGGNDPVTITVYAWASELVLTMPTSLTTLTALNYTPQAGRMKGKMNSGDEYGQGIISGPASAVAEAAGSLKNVPMIGPYARATEMIAGTAGAVAAHWGYSRPPIVSDIVQQKPFPSGNVCNTDAADAVQKLSLDSKQEITIDSRTVGLDGEDQMDILRFCQRESYLDTFTLNPNEGPDTILWNARVTPVQFRLEGAEIHSAPMALMSVPFKKWQGSMKYRFQIVKSNFHKGKILLRWDPRSHGASVEYNTVYSRVIDIAECDDFEITIGWGQSVPFLDCGTLTTPENFSTTRFATDNSGLTNGVLEVNVVNSLVSPALDSPIQFNVFVSACDDLKFGSPTVGEMKQYGLWPTPVVQANLDYSPQSGEMDMGSSEVDAPTNPDSIAPIATGGTVSDQTMNVFFGESPKSIRELNRRYILHRTEVFDGPTGANNIQLLSLTEKGLGYFPGWDPNGIDTEQGSSCTITLPTYAQWFSPCYAGWRGSTRVKYNYGGNTDSKPVVMRFGFSNRARRILTSVPITTSEQATKKLTFNNGQYTSGGAATTNIGINDTIEVEVPYYNGVRFSSARQPTASFVNGCESTNSALASGEKLNENNSLVMRSWRSVGEDFTLFFFTGTPIIYRNQITPA